MDSPLEPRGRRRVQPLDALTSASGRTRVQAAEGRGGRAAGSAAGAAQTGVWPVGSAGVLERAKRASCK